MEDSQKTILRNKYAAKKKRKDGSYYVRSKRREAAAKAAAKAATKGGNKNIQKPQQDTQEKSEEEGSSETETSESDELDIEEETGLNIHDITRITEQKPIEENNNQIKRKQKKKKSNFYSQDFDQEVVEQEVQAKYLDNPSFVLKYASQSNSTEINANTLKTNTDKTNEQDLKEIQEVENIIDKSSENSNNTLEVKNSTDVENEDQTVAGENEDKIEELEDWLDSVL